MKYLRELDDLSGKRVVLRVDFNVPIKNDHISDDFRIIKTLPTIKYLIEKGAITILLSHIESLDGSISSLEPVCNYLSSLDIKCRFVKDITLIGDAVSEVGGGGVIMLENIRNYEGEKANDKLFAKELASVGDIYVNEAFSVSHREHASISSIASFIPSYAGFLFEDEVKNLSTAFDPIRPFLFILGGAKFDTKLPLIKKFNNIADKIFITGALSNNFLKEKGLNIGKSLISDKFFGLKDLLSGNRIELPTDVVVGKGITKEVDSISEEDCVFDVGIETTKKLISEIEKAKYILWNGTLGAYESGYIEPTLEIAKAIAKATSSGAKSIIGGGDTLAAISRLGIEDQFTFVSTGGGAMLDFLSSGTLPGILALENSK